ncbi:MAG: lytic transglycosylase domain-containing protein [Sulfurospirillaceae bacterium]|nr:lytic transglycosylase domain-containing protein [Sulfurospirillaceae bacterium]
MRKVLLLTLLPMLLFAKSYNYWINAGERFGIEPRLLYAIAKIESNVDRFLISVNFKKLSQQEIKHLLNTLNKKKIEHIKYTKVISIKSKNLDEAKYVIDFLSKNNYPSFDMGIMQINSVHKDLIEKSGMSFYDLFDEKINTQVGAFILSECFKRHKNNKNAINAYNGKIDGNPYSTKVLVELQKLYLPHEKYKTRLYYRVM